MAIMGKVVARSYRHALLVLACAAPFALSAACGGAYGSDDAPAGSEGGATTTLLDGDGGAAQKDSTSSATPDATTASTTPEAGADAGACPLKNLLSNHDVENGGVGWLQWNAILAVTPGAARTGTGGLQVCRHPSVSEYDADQKFATPLPLGTYYGRAWLRADPDAGAGNGEIYITDETAYAATFKPVGQVGSTWTCAEVTTKTPQLVGSFGLGGQSAALGTCVDGDDTALYRVPADGIVPDACKCPP